MAAGAVCLLILDEHQVRALEHEKRLGCITMEVERRTELRRFTLRLNQAELTARLSRCGQDLGVEIAQIEVPALAGRDDECLAHAEHDPLSHSLPQ
jgi:hypothetical protein